MGKKKIKGVVITQFKIKDTVYKVGDDFVSNNERTVEILINKKRIKI